MTKLKEERRDMTPDSSQMRTVKKNVWNSKTRVMMWTVWRWIFKHQATMGKFPKAKHKGWDLNMGKREVK